MKTHRTLSPRSRLVGITHPLSVRFHHQVSTQKVLPAGTLRLLQVQVRIFRKEDKGNGSRGPDSEQMNGDRKQLPLLLHIHSPTFLSFVVASLLSNIVVRPLLIGDLVPVADPQSRSKNSIGSPLALPDCSTLSTPYWLVPE